MILLWAICKKQGRQYFIGNNGVEKQPVSGLKNITFGQDVLSRSLQRVFAVSPSQAKIAELWALRQILKLDSTEEFWLSVTF